VFPLAPEPGTVNRALGTDDRGEATPRRSEAWSLHRTGNPGCTNGRRAASAGHHVPARTIAAAARNGLPARRWSRPASADSRHPCARTKSLPCRWSTPRPHGTMLASGASLALPPGLTPLPPGTGVIRGRVLRSDGQPLARARINATTTPDSIVPLTDGGECGWRL
jgi:hypothetical protein